VTAAAHGAYIGNLTTAYCLGTLLINCSARLQGTASTNLGPSASVAERPKHAIPEVKHLHKNDGQY